MVPSRQCRARLSKGGDFSRPHPPLPPYPTDCKILGKETNIWFKVLPKSWRCRFLQSARSLRSQRPAQPRRERQPGRQPDWQPDWKPDWQPDWQRAGRVAHLRWSARATVPGALAGCRVALETLKSTSRLPQVFQLSRCVPFRIGWWILELRIQCIFLYYGRCIRFWSGKNTVTRFSLSGGTAKMSLEDYTKKRAMVRNRAPGLQGS